MFFRYMKINNKSKYATYILTYLFFGDALLQNCYNSLNLTVIFGLYYMSMMNDRGKLKWL